jgi:hypothetical protein
MKVLMMTLLLGALVGFPELQRRRRDRRQNAQTGESGMTFSRIVIPL